MTVAVRFDCLTKSIPEEKINSVLYTTSTSTNRQHGQLVRKLFQPKELSTVMQERNMKLRIGNRLCNKSNTH